MADGRVLVQGDYIGEAKDEPSIYRTYLGERKGEFYFDFITAAAVQQVADELLAQNKQVKVYFDCPVRGNPYLNLLDKARLTAPKCSVANLQCQIIKIDHTIESGKWMTVLGLVAELIQTAVIMHLDKDPPDHLDAGYYVDQTK